MMPIIYPQYLDASRHGLVNNQMNMPPFAVPEYPLHAEVGRRVCSGCPRIRKKAIVCAPHRHMPFGGRLVVPSTETFQRL